MFIKVKYGDDETLLCNPSCAAVNLMWSIKRRTGYEDKAIVLDLSDDKGFVQELESRKNDCASAILTSDNRTYILVKKQVLSTSPSSPFEETDPPAGDYLPLPRDGGADNPPPAQYEYVPLLNNCVELFPDYKLRVQAKETGLQKRSGQQRPPRRKAASPAGLKATKGKALTKRRN